MAEISQITLPSGTTYDLKDTVARQAASGGITLRGETTTELVDEATTNPITINGESYTAVAQDAVFYGKKEFVFDGTKWHEFGDMSGLGGLATKDSASGTFTPQGTVSQPTISVATAGTTDTFATSVDTAAPGATAPSNAITYYSVSNEVLSLYQIGYSTDTAKTGDASYNASAPTFTGTQGTVTVE